MKTPKLSPAVAALYAEFRSANPALLPVAPQLLGAYGLIVRAFARGGRLYICGNGGSFADSLHIAGELVKSFERKRPVDRRTAAALARLPGGRDVAMHLERGLPAIALGANPAVSSAVANDCRHPDMPFAQELYAMARRGDVFIGLSTSGNARNVAQAAMVARALGVTVISFTGAGGGRLAGLADLAVRVPASVTKCVQEEHLAIYHALCAMVEAHFFPEKKH